MKRTLPFSAAFAAALIAATATAQEWSRSGPNGSVTRSLEHGSGMTIDRTGVNGGSSGATVTCQRGGGASCQRDVSLTNADGQTVTGQRTTARDPFRAGATTTVTGPEGNTATRSRIAPRYRAAGWRPRARRALRW